MDYLKRMLASGLVCLELGLVGITGCKTPNIHPTNLGKVTGYNEAKYQSDENYLGDVVMSSIDGHVIAGHLVNEASSLTSKLTKNDEIDQGVNNYLSSFGANLEGGHKVTKIKIEGAKHLLVHIRQIHYSPDFETEEQQRRVEEIQNEISEILDESRLYLPGAEIYGEGIHEDQFLEDYLKCAKEYDLITKEKIHQECFPNNLGPLRLSATAQLLADRKVRVVRAAEDKSLHKKAVTIFKDETGLYSPEEINYNVLTRREDTLLEKVTDKGVQIAIATYGAAHNWADNILKWNEENPDDKFSLMVITPESLLSESEVSD